MISVKQPVRIFFIHPSSGFRDDRFGLLVSPWLQSTLGWIALKFGSDIQGSQRMEPTNFGYHLMFKAPICMKVIPKMQTNIK